MELEFEDAVRAKVLKLLTDYPHVLSNLSMEDLPLAPAIRVMAETVACRVKLGENPDTAIKVTVDLFEAFLEGPPASEAADYASFYGFCKFMFETAVPAIAIPGRTIVTNENAVELDLRG